MPKSHLTQKSRTEYPPAESFHKEISAEQKLELIRQIRSQYRQNQNDLMHRESILYDKPMASVTNIERTLPLHDDSSDTYYASYQASKKGFQREGTLKIRFVLAVLLTASVILFHKSHFSPAGINMEQVFATLEQDYEDIILSWSSSLIKTAPAPNRSTAE